MINGWYCILLVISAFILGIASGFFCWHCENTEQENVNENNIGARTERILQSNNILLKISLWKMIIGFAQKDELGRYYTGVNGFVSDAFCRLGIESHTVNEQMALEKIENLDRALGEL